MTEGSEEVASDLINWAADVLVAKDKSQWNQAIQAYEAQGMGKQEAFLLTLQESSGRGIMRTRNPPCWRGKALMTRRARDMDKSRQEKEREGLELFRQHMERVKQMSPEERAAHEAKVEAFGKAFMPEGRMWHRIDEED